MATGLNYHGLDINLANCAGFLVANQFTYIGHTIFTFDKQRTFRLRYSYLIISLILLIISSSFVYLFFYICGYASWFSIFISTILSGVLNYFVLLVFFVVYK